jgi:hypothetical protein
MMGKQIDRVPIPLQSSNTVRNKGAIEKEVITTSHLHSHPQTLKNKIPFFVIAKGSNSIEDNEIILHISVSSRANWVLHSLIQTNTMVGSTERFNTRREEAGSFLHFEKLVRGKETELVGDALPEVFVGLEPWDGVLLLIPVLLAHERA